MIKVENTRVYNIANAIYSARNAMNSWDKSDSDLENDIVGPNDLDLAHRLYVAGHPHRKYLRQIMVSMDITAPLYWWKEFDTYKVGTTANSCSTMHKIHSKEFELDDFSHEHLNFDYNGNQMVHSAILGNTINELNGARRAYLETKDKKFWWVMIQLLPSSYNQKRTISMNYENVFNMLLYRENHKLDEWNELCKIFKDLPYVREIMDENRYLERRAMR